MMRKCKKQIIWFLTVLTLMMSIPCNVMATEILETTETFESADNEQQGLEAEIESDVSEEIFETNVYDYAGLLTETEILWLERQIMSLKEASGWEVFAVTTADAQGKSAMEYANDFFDERTLEDADGIVALIDMDNREIYISSGGKAMRYLEDTYIESILDDAYYYVSEGDYEGCLSAMISGAKSCFEQEIHEDQYNYDVETEEISEYRVLTSEEAVPVLLVAAGVGIAIYAIVVKSYKSNGKNHSYEYMRYGSLDLTQKEDRFIRQNVVHHRIRTAESGGSSSRHSGGSSSGHRSSTHRSSSGRSHGGGGRKF